MKTIQTVFGIILVLGCLLLLARSRPAHAQGIPHDWSHQHVVFSKPASPDALRTLEQEPRYQIQQAWRARQALLGDSAATFDAHSLQMKRTVPLKRDWSVSLGSAFAKVGNGMFPAKFSFDTGTANCTSAPNPDYVAFGTGVEGSATQASIIAFDNLYGSGFCPGTVPTVYWSYNAAAAHITTSVVLSIDGSQLAFISTPGSGMASLNILKWKAGQGTSATTPVSPDSVTAIPGTYVTCRGGNTSCLLHLAFANGDNDGNSAPFYNYASDALYVGDNNDFLHKFTGVFNGTPREVTTGGWPVKVGNIPIVMNSPAFDSGSNNIFFSDELGDLKYVKEVGSVTGVCSGGGAEPCLGTVDGTPSGPNFIALSGAVVDGPLVDTTTGTVFFFSGPGNAGSNVCGSADNSPCFGIVEQTNTQLGNPVTANIGGPTQAGNIHAGFFDNTYLNVGPATGFLYVCGKGRRTTNNQPTFSRIGFSAAGVMNTTTSADLTLANSSSSVECSPVTEIDNGTTDRMFVSVPANGDLRGVCSGTCLGACLYSFDVTSSFPATCSARLVATSGTSGIIIDNTVGTAGASEVYFTPLSGGMAVQASQAGLN